MPSSRTPYGAALLVGVLLCTPASEAWADEAPADGGVCLVDHELPIERVLRRLSIDLRGTVPSMAEYAEVSGATDVPSALIDTYLASDEFRMQMRRYHESLLWTNPVALLIDVNFTLSAATVDGVVLYRVQGRRSLYRGGDGTSDCQNKPQSDLGYNGDGSPIAEVFPMIAGVAVRREGWVEVHPYWDPNPAAVLKICAFDAQTTASYTVLSGADAGTYSCDHVAARTKTDKCGCGPNANYCIVSAPVATAVVASMREQLLRSVDDHTAGGEPYSAMLTTKKAYLNGTLSHYFTYLAQQQVAGSTQNGYQPSDGVMPSIPYLESGTWTAYTRGEPHSGVLTLPAYLLRFQTLRGRANRYRIAFQGQYFAPPGSKDVGCLEAGNDLTLRCVCRGCHITLEPLAAHFSQFVDAGTTSLYDFAESFATRAECLYGALPYQGGWCDRYYVTVPSISDPDVRPYKLKALEYDDAEHPLVAQNRAAGADGLAQADIDSGLFHKVAVTSLFEQLMTRAPELDVTSPDYEGETIAALAKSFKEHDDLKQTIRELVALPSYRRLP